MQPLRKLVSDEINLLTIKEKEMYELALNLPAGWSYDEATGVLTVPEGTTTIGIHSGFTNNTEITKVIIPEGITTIGDQVFRGCSSLTSVVIPNSVTSIGTSTFNGCSSLTEINIPESVTNIGGYAFAGSGILEFIVRPGVTFGSYPLKQSGLKSLIYLDKDGLKGATFPNNLALECTNVKDIYINASKSDVVPSIIISSALKDDNTSDTMIAGAKNVKMHFIDDADYDTWKDKFPTTEEAVPGDNTELGTTIDAANAVKGSVTVSIDGSDVESTSKWVTQSEFDALQTAIDAATSVFNNSAVSQEEIDNAKTALENAVTTFNNNKKEGTKMPDTTTTPNNEMICVSEEMLQLLVTQILTKVNSRIAARIVNTISDESDANHVPSALAVLNFIRTFSPNMKYQTVTGSIDTITEPAATTIYLQRDDEADQTWVMYLPIDGEWVSIGDTSIDLVNYWSKSEADVNALREQVLNETGLTLIKEGIDYDNLFKDNTATKQIILNWLDSGTLVHNTAEGLAALYVELDKRYVQIANLKVVTTEQIQNAVNAAYAATEPEI